MSCVWNDDDEEAEHPLRARFGDDLLEFLLNGVAVEDVQADDDPRQEALATLRGIAELVPDAAPINQRHFIDAQLTRSTSTGLTLANAMRSACGGELPEAASDEQDLVAHSLHDMAVFGFALELLDGPSARSDLSMRPSRRFTGVSLREPFRTCFMRILEDPELSRLFPEPAVESRWNMTDPMEARFRFS